MHECTFSKLTVSFIIIINDYIIYILVLRNKKKLPRASILLIWFIFSHTQFCKKSEWLFTNLGIIYVSFYHLVNDLCTTQPKLASKTLQGLMFLSWSSFSPIFCELWWAHVSSQFHLHQINLHYSTKGGSLMVRVSWTITLVSLRIVVRVVAFQFQMRAHIDSFK